MREFPVGGQFAHQQGYQYQLKLDKSKKLVGRLGVDMFPDNMIGGPWVEVYSPNGKNNYKRRRCREDVGGHIRKKNIRYLGSVNNV